MKIKKFFSYFALIICYIFMCVFIIPFGLYSLFLNWVEDLRDIINCLDETPINELTQR